MCKQNDEHKRAESVSENLEEEMIFEWQLDCKISESLHMMLKDFPVPNGEHAWLLMKQRLFGQNRLIYKRKRRRKMTSAAICMVIAVSLSIGSFVSSANLSDFYRLVKVIGNGAVHYVFDTAGNDQGGLSFAGEELNLSDDLLVDGNNEQVIFELQKAIAALAYKPLLPTYVPTGYELVKAKVIFDPLHEGKDILRLEYENELNELVYFQQQPIMHDSSHVPLTIYEGTGEAEVVQIGDYEGVLLYYSQAGINLTWSQSGVYLNASGDWSKQEMLRFARSLH